jgi:PKD repeat protein/guanyl-specific ribonuclease Sa
MKISSILFTTLFFLASFNLKAQNFYITGPESLCPGQCGTYFLNGLDSLNTGNYFFLWTLNGISFPNTGFPSEVFTACEPGLLYVTITGPNGFATGTEFYIEQSSNNFIEIRSDNPQPCNDSIPIGVDYCEKVCPFSTVTYTAYSFTGFVGNAFWNVQGALSYIVNNQQGSITVTWGNTGNGSISVSSLNSICGGQSEKCVTIIETPIAKIATLPAPQNNLLTICKGQSVYFQNQSLNADSYAWDFGNGVSSEEANPIHTYLSAGTYEVQLIARSACLCSDTTTFNIEVLDAQSPLLDCVGTICPNETVTYTTSSSCSNYNWSISPNGTIAGGGNSGDNSITVEWLNGPVGSINLTVSGCTGSVCNLPSLVQIPIIDNNAQIGGPAKVCPAETATYSITPFGGTDFNWTISGGGQIISGQGTDKIEVEWSDFASATTYWVIVNYNNCYLGCGGIDSLEVNILSPFIVNGPIEICENSIGNFTSKSTGTGANVLCNWTLTDLNGTIAWTSPSATATPMIPFNAGIGAYRIEAISSVNSSVCNEKAEWITTVIAKPSKPTGLLGEKIVCPNTAYLYEVQVANSFNNIVWQTQNGSTPNTVLANDTRLLTWGVSNPRWVAVAQVTTDGNACKSDTLRLDIQSITNFSIAGLSGICAENESHYSIPNYPNLDILWEIIPSDAGTISGGNGTSEIDIFWIKAGNHQLKATVCGQSQTLNVTVFGKPEPIVLAPAGLCPNFSDVVTTTITNYSAWNWKNEVGQTISTNPSDDFSAGSFSLEVTDLNGCKGSSEFTIQEFPSPNIKLTTPDPTGFCNNSRTVTIYALVSEDGDYTYNWSKDGVTLGNTTSTYTTNQYGNYSVGVVNQYGCPAKDGPINVFEYCGGGVCHNPSHPVTCPPGTIDIAIDPTSECDRFDFDAQAGSQYVAGSANWAFGESGSAFLGSSTLETPSFQFPNAGWYIVVLYANSLNGGQCKDLDSVKVKIAAKFDADPKCPGSATIFKDVSTFMPDESIDTWSWDFDDPTSGANNISTQRNPSHIFSQGGSYLVTLTISSPSGCTSQYTQLVEIQSKPAVNFALPSQTCEDNALPFVSTSGTNIIKTTWDFGDPTSNAANQAESEEAFHNFANAGNYMISLSTTNVFGCTANISKNLVITANSLNGNIISLPNTSICEGKSAQLTAPTAVNYLWSQGSTTKIINTTNEGVYTVTLSDASGCTFVPSPVNVSVSPAPDATMKALIKNEIGQTIAFEYPNLVICEGEDVFLQLFGANNYNYNWPDGSFGSNNEFSETRGNLLTAGIYNYIVTVTDASSGCTSVADPFMVDVNAKPSGFSITTGVFPQCSGSPTTFNYVGTAPANWQFNWNNGAVGQSLTTEAAGEYFMRVTNEFGCSAESNHATIIKGPNKNAIPSGCHTRCNPDTLCLPTLPSIVSMQWLYNGSPITGATNQQLIATQDGSYSLLMTDYLGCKTESEPLTLELFTGYGDIKGQVWSDVNDNGIIDVTDTLMSNIGINLLKNNILQSQINSSTTGNFTFVNIESTAYSVNINPTTLPSGWQIIIGQSIETLSGCDDEETCAFLLRFECLPVTETLNLKACQGDSIKHNNQWIQAGNSRVFNLTTATGCDSTLTVSVAEIAKSSTEQVAFVCPNMPYLFQNDSLFGGETRTYNFIGSEGCDSIIILSVQNYPSLDFQVETVNSCPNTPNGSATLTQINGGLSPFQYSLDGVSFQSEANFMGLDSGFYSFFINDANDCIFEQTATINASMPLNVSLSNAFLPCDSAGVTLAPLVSGDTTLLGFRWSDGSTFSTKFTTEPTNLWVEVYNQCDLIRKEITVAWADTTEEGRKLLDFLYVPNAFNPSGGSNGNELFLPQISDGIKVFDYQLGVYDRWGELLFKSNNPTEPWGGPFRKRNTLPGVYVWVLEMRVGVCGREISVKEKGDVVVVR